MPANQVSVPQVSPIEDLKWAVARLLEKALHHRRMTGDGEPLALALAEAQRLIEEELKPLANLGKLDRRYVNELVRSLEALR